MLRTEDPQRLIAEEHEVFFAAHLRLAFAVLVVLSVDVMVYLATTPDGPSRSELWLVTASCGGLGIVGALCSGVIARQSWRTTLALACSLVVSVIVTVCALVDGGITSPLVLLLWAPIVNAGLALEPAPTAVCGTAGLGQLVLLAGVSNKRVDTGTLVLLAGTMVGATMLAVASSLNRGRVQRHQRKLTNQLFALSQIDGVTGCLNRRAFDARLEEEVHRALRYHAPLALLMVDIDRFKSINDARGHQYGDAVLAGVGGAAQADGRPGDVVSRIGGDEFAVLLPHTKSHAALRCAERLRARMTQRYGSDVTLSVGVAVLGGDARTPHALLAAADRALYSVKQHGRDGIALASADVRQADSGPSALPTNPGTAYGRRTASAITTGGHNARARLPRSG